MLRLAGGSSVKRQEYTLDTTTNTFTLYPFWPLSLRKETALHLPDFSWTEGIAGRSGDDTLHWQLRPVFPLIDLAESASAQGMRGVSEKGVKDAMKGVR